MPEHENSDHPRQNWLQDRHTPPSQASPHDVSPKQVTQVTDDLTDMTDMTSADDQRMASMLDIPFIVTIDGPAASGKSSVSRELAKRLGWSWVSTGSFYRGLAYVAHRAGLDLTDETAVVQMARSANWSVQMTPEETRVFLDQEDVTEAIAREEVGTFASKISSLPSVRLALLDAQRQCAKNVVGLIAEGRDCGTVVFPAAQLKIFLTARAEDRAARRARDEGRDVQQTIIDQKQRDAQDANRKTAPMQASADANQIDTTQLGFAEVVGRIEGLIRDRLVALSH